MPIFTKEKKEGEKAKFGRKMTNLTRPISEGEEIEVTILKDMRDERDVKTSSAPATILERMQSQGHSTPERELEDPDKEVEK